MNYSTSILQTFEKAGRIAVCNSHVCQSHHDKNISIFCHLYIILNLKLKLNLKIRISEIQNPRTQKIWNKIRKQFGKLPNEFFVPRMCLHMFLSLTTFFLISIVLY